MVKYPRIGSRWRHRNGNLYIVLCMANTQGEDPTKWEKYPPTVVYQGENGKTWARAFSDWDRSMTEEPENG